MAPKQLMPFERQYCRFMMNETDPRDQVCTTCGCIENPQVFEAAWLTPWLLVNSQAMCQQVVDIFSQRARSDIRDGEISLVVSCRLVVILEVLVDAVRQIMVTRLLLRPLLLGLRPLLGVRPLLSQN